MTKTICRVIRVNETRTSICLTNLEWDAIDIFCEAEHIRRNILLGLIARYRDENEQEFEKEREKKTKLEKQSKKKKTNLTSAVRLFLLQYFKTLSSKIKKSRTNTPDFNNIFKILNDIFKS